MTPTTSAQSQAGGMSADGAEPGAVLVFMDTETTGLSLDDDIWEFAAIRRGPDGVEASLHLFIEHNLGKCSQLPESFLADHRARFPSHDRLPASALARGGVHSRQYAAGLIADLFHDRPHVVGAVPNFDTERVALLLSRFGLKPGWHYHLIDVENLAVGYLAGVAARAVDEAKMRGDEPPTIYHERIAPPWDSDTLSRSVGVEPPTDERHTAMGDVRWAMALYDAIIGVSK